MFGNLSIEIWLNCVDKRLPYIKMHYFCRREVRYLTSDDAVVPIDFLEQLCFQPAAYTLFVGPDGEGEKRIPYASHSL